MFRDQGVRRNTNLRIVEVMLQDEKQLSQNKQFEINIPDYVPFFRLTTNLEPIRELVSITISWGMWLSENFKKLMKQYLKTEVVFVPLKRRTNHGQYPARYEEIRTILQNEIKARKICVLFR